ncbi:MAG: AtpZ/AtpI family protein [Bacteroidetes bacterium]|nr:AtpZ/AtpI family protein [Bacteroidota bacterium]MBI3482521.1 AtpZ/AtpI family protein [Bacteroidota bacterium]
MEEKKTQNNFLKYSSLGLQLLFTIGLCAWIGLKIDQYFALKFPAFLLSFTLLSFAGMMYKLYRSLNE